MSINISRVFAQAGAGGADSAAADPAAAAQTAAERIRAAEEALALDIPAAEGETPAAAPSSTFTVFKMVLVLALVAAAIYGVVHIFRRAARRGETADPFLKVLASAHLGQGRYAHVVALGQKAWLVGAADGGVNLLGEVDDKDALDAMRLEDSRKNADSGGRLLDFKSMLRRLGMYVEPSVPGADNIRRRRERLKGL